MTKSLTTLSLMLAVLIGSTGVGYNKDGTVFKVWTGTFKNGKKISD